MFIIILCLVSLTADFKSDYFEIFQISTNALQITIVTLMLIVKIPKDLTGAHATRVMKGTA